MRLSELFCRTIATVDFWFRQCSTRLYGRVERPQYKQARFNPRPRKPVVPLTQRSCENCPSALADELGECIMTLC